jgi:hypothetical protein
MTHAIRDTFRKKAFFARPGVAAGVAFIEILFPQAWVFIIILFSQPS